MRVFWNPQLRNPKTGKPTLCNARGDEDFDIPHQWSVEKMLYRQTREEEEARLNFVASVRPETASAILGELATSVVTISNNSNNIKWLKRQHVPDVELDNQPSCQQKQSIEQEVQKNRK
jgi:hypothetical protein